MGRLRKSEREGSHKLCLSTRRKSRKGRGRFKKNINRNNVPATGDEVVSNPNEISGVQTIVETPHEELHSKENDTPVRSQCNTERHIEVDISGRRIFDVRHLFSQILNSEKHEPFDCSIADMQVISEQRNGLRSVFSLECRMCKLTKKISSEENVPDTLDVNSASVIGSISVGIGHSQLTELAASLNMPMMSLNTFNDYHGQVAEIIRSSAWKTMEEAANEETELAIKAAEVDCNGIPCITVVTDGAWAKRSYNVNYDSLSGVACIIGYRTGKILFMGVRNKYCSLCSWYENKNKDVPPHKCYKNWSGTSTSMETDIIVDGFRKSTDMYNIKYTKIVGDGDSSVYRKLLQMKPYGNTLVQKIECKNHLLRNFCKKIREICTKKRSSSNNVPVPFSLRKQILSRLMRLRTAITKATNYRINEVNSLERKIELLRGDIRNAPSHIFGEHEKCREIEYFRCENVNDKNFIPAMKECGIYNDMMTAIQRLLDNSSSLIMNMNNNLAEHYNSIVCKFVGGKRVNYSLGGSYQTRCEAAAVSFNSSGQYYQAISKFATGASPKKFTKQYMERCQNKKCGSKRQLFQRKKLTNKTQLLGDEDYGPNAHYIPLVVGSDEFNKKVEEFLSQLKKTKQEIRDIERFTIGQASNPQWMQERSLRLTASNFGQICKMRSSTSPCNAIKNLLYGNFSGNSATNYGRQCEVLAIRDFELEMSLKVSQCGFYIDEEHFYLGASPDGVTDTDALIEVKCPYNIVKISPQQGIEKGIIKFAAIVDGKLQLKRTHNYYYQVQGQLAISKRTICYFIIWSPLGMLVEQIPRDEQFWEQMTPKLKSFYHNCLLPELVDPLYPKGLPIRGQ